MLLQVIPILFGRWSDVNLKAVAGTVVATPLGTHDAEQKEIPVSGG
jgi:hypothetical protein